MKLNRILTVFCFLAFFMYLYKIGDIPAGISTDEVRFGIFFSNLIGGQFTPIYILRLPFAILGALNIYLYYVLLKKLTYSDKFSLLAAFTYALSPLVIRESRILSQGTVLTSTVLLLSVLLFKYTKNHLKKISNVFLVLGLVLLVVSLFTFSPDLKNRVDYQRNIASKSVPNIVGKVFSNKLVESYRTKEKLLFENLDFGNYFFAGYPRERWGVEETLKMYAIFLPLLLIGIFKTKTGNLNILIKIFMGYIIFLTAFGLQDPAYSLPIVALMSPLVAEGVVFIGRKNILKPVFALVCVVFIYEVINFLQIYNLGKSESLFSPRRTIFGKLTQDAQTYSENKNSIVISPRVKDPGVYFKYYQPGLIQKIDIRNFELKKESDPNALYVGVLPFDPSPAEQLYKKDESWPEHIRVLSVVEDMKLRQSVIIFESKL